MAKIITVWVREDGEPPCCLERGAPARGPGRVFEVEAKNRRAAVELVRLAMQPEPSKREDRAGWNKWDEACELVVERI